MSPLDRSRRRSALPAVSALALSLAVFAPFLAQDRAGADDDKLAWNLTDELHRYELEETTPCEKPGIWVEEVCDKMRLLRANDFEKKTRPKWVAGDVADLVWIYAFSLPEDKGSSVKIDEVFAMLSQGEVVVTGTDEVTKGQNGTTELKAKLSLSVRKAVDVNGVPLKGRRLQDGTLTVERTFDDTKHMLIEARFELHANVREGTPASEDHKGKISFKGKVDSSSRDFLRDVQAAIQRGTVALKDKLKTLLASDPKKVWLQGEIALTAFALLRSGVPPEELKQAFDALEAAPFKETYTVSLYVMCLEAKYVHRKEVPVEAGGHLVARFRKQPVPEAARKEMARAVEWLLQGYWKGTGSWSYLKGKQAGATYADRSNTQFAILALQVAASSGVDVDTSVWGEIVDELDSGQQAEGPTQTLAGIVWAPNCWKDPPDVHLSGGGGSQGPSSGQTHTKDKDKKPDGGGEEAFPDAKARGWTYWMTKKPAAPGLVYGSMTAAGLSSAAISRERLRAAKLLDKNLDAVTKREIVDGVAWFAKNWSPRHNAGAGLPRPGKEDFYYLYSVEKAMELAGVEMLNGHDWWHEGSAQLLQMEDQPKKGLWNNGSISDTCLALLFLNRATLPARVVVADKVKVVTGQQDPDAWDQVKVEGLGYVRMEQVLDAIGDASADQWKDFARIAEKGFDLLQDESKIRITPSLIALYGIPSKEIHKFVLRALKATTGFEDETKANAFADAWKKIEAIVAARDYDSIDRIKATLVAKDSNLALKRGILNALVKLRAVEALGDVIGELANKDVAYRKDVARSVVSLAGGEKCPYDANGKDADRAVQQADWKSWFDKSRTALVAAEDARRSVERLAGNAEVAGKAEAHVRELGKAAVPALIEGLDSKAKDKALALLKEITKKDFPDRKAWAEWWDKEGSKG